MRNTAVRNYPARRRSLSCHGWISRKKTPEELDVIYTYRRSVAPVLNAVETHPELSEEDGCGTLRVMSSIAVLALFATAIPNAVVLKPVANMYSNPTEDADVVSQAIFGANVQLMEQREGWAHVRTADEYTGWIPLAQLRPGAPYAESGRAAQVMSQLAHVYRESDVTKHAPLITVPFETRLEVTSMPAPGGRWIQLRLPDDRAGWIQSGDVAFDVKPLDIPDRKSVV